MAHFAKVENGVVTNVIVIDQETLNLGHWGDPSLWVQTSYNTQANKHTQGGTPVRGNYAGIGYTYDKNNDVFYPPQPFASWSISAATDWVWTPPSPMPVEEGKMYQWNEETKAWVEIVPTANTAG
jgi:hypothetical protein